MSSGQKIDAVHVESVRVYAPARLHLGFLDLEGGLGRRFGGLGLAIDEPYTELRLRAAEGFAATGLEAERALALLRRFAEALNLEQAYAVHTEKAIPAHAGLGSGTQLTLAIAAALLRLRAAADGTAVPETWTGTLGSLAGRGARSAIGMAAFRSGGFIADGGRGEKEAPPPVLVRLPFPETWRVLLVLDRRKEGMHGEKETAAFARLPPFPAALAGHLCRLVLMKLLPGIAEKDLGAFGAAMTEIQRALGEHFAPVQGGNPWSSPAVGRIVARLGAGGAVGLGQSSWGPTGFAFVEGEYAAARLVHSVSAEAAAEGLEILITRGRNAGARIERLAAAQV